VPFKTQQDSSESDEYISRSRLRRRDDLPSRRRNERIRKPSYTRTNDGSSDRRSASRCRDLSENSSYPQQYNRNDIPTVEPTVQVHGGVQQVAQSGGLSGASIIMKRDIFHKIATDASDLQREDKVKADRKAQKMLNPPRASKWRGDSDPCS
jgi:hypothetical protein